MLLKRCSHLFCSDFLFWIRTDVPKKKCEKKVIVNCYNLQELVVPFKIIIISCLLLKFPSICCCLREHFFFIYLGIYPCSQSTFDRWSSVGLHRTLLNKTNHESVNVCLIVWLCVWRRSASIFISLIHSDNMLFFSHFSCIICLLRGADVIWYDSTRF